MIYRKLGTSTLEVSIISLGTWAFGGDKWWGPQEDRDSLAVLDEAIVSGLNTIDTAPVYGRGRSERLIGDFINKRKCRGRVVLATKVGLSWQGAKIRHDLRPIRMMEEVDESRARLRTDYFDLYQVHWPDPETPIAAAAETMHKLFQKKIIRSIGVSNFSAGQMEEFMKYCPLHSLQPPYSMFERTSEQEIIPFCRKHSVAVLSYAPLYSGLLTGKYFGGGVSVPDDLNRKMKRAELEEPRLSLNQNALRQLKSIADSYGKTLTQLALNWNFHQDGITAAIAGARRRVQLRENLGSFGWQISRQDTAEIERILNNRLASIEDRVSTGE